jgi:putative addiction module component (TIGR02574 family)
MKLSTLDPMSGLTKEIEDKAMRLSAIERVNLAEKLLSSLDSPEQRLIDEKWACECENRIEAFESGKMEAVDAATIFERLERKSKE